MCVQDHVHLPNCPLISWFGVAMFLFLFFLKGSLGLHDNESTYYTAFWRGYKVHSLQLRYIGNVPAATTDDYLCCACYVYRQSSHRYRKSVVIGVGRGIRIRRRGGSKGLVHGSKGQGILLLD